MGMNIKQKSVERFWSKVEKTSSCWVWTAYKDKDGYGNLTINRLPNKSHRFSYELTYGAIPKGMCVCHTCDNPSCVNPKHLWLGTFKENNRDRENKNRGADRRGEKCPTAKLGKQAILRIRSMSPYYLQKEIAKAFGVSQSNISKVVNKKTWI